MNAHGARTSFLVDGNLTASIGLGTFAGGGNENTLVEETVLEALRLGYRHIDTAAAYGNEKEVGNVIKASGIHREDLFITTKLDNTWHQPSDVEQALDRSLAALQVEYVDLYLMHFPYAYATGPDHSKLRHLDGKPVMDESLSRRYTDTWSAMAALVDKGKAKLIGISNFNMLKTRRLLQQARIKPAALQIELHPYLPQVELVKFCAEQGIHAIAHQPLGGKPIAAVNPNSLIPGPLQDPLIQRIAQTYGKSPAQVLLSWAIQRGTSVVPKSVKAERLAENLDTFALRNEHMEAIDRLGTDRGPVRYLDPKDYVGFDVFDEQEDEPVVR